MPITSPVAATATDSATTGDATIASSVLRTLLQATAATPPEANPAPIRPPMIAWEDEEGIPMCHVA